MKRRGQGTLYKQRASQFWWYRIGYQGRVIAQSTKTTDKQEALEILKQKRRELEAAKGGYITLPGPEAKRVTINQLCDGLLLEQQVKKLRSIAGARSSIKHLRAAFGEMPVGSLTAKDIQQYRMSRQRDGAADATINREHTLLMQAIRPFLESQRLPVPRVPLLRENNTREGYFERADLEALTQHLPADLRDFTRFAYLTGWRRNEISSLKWDNIDKEGKSITLSWRDSKNRQSRVMPLAGDLGEIIKRQSIGRAERVLAGKDSPYVFLRATGRPVKGFSGAWRTACDKAGIKGRLFHDLRRTAVRNMIRAGIDPSVAMKVSGHKSYSVFQRYNIIDDRDIAAAMQKTAAYIAKQPTRR